MEESPKKRTKAPDMHPSGDAQRASRLSRSESDPSGQTESSGLNAFQAGKPTLSKMRSMSPHDDSDTEPGLEKASGEDKKLRRKQSNRESARRSRLRKQAESEALSLTITSLQQENLHLKAANKAMACRIEQLLAQLKERSSSDIFKPRPRNGAFQPVVPNKKPLQLKEATDATRLRLALQQCPIPASSLQETFERNSSIVA